MNVIALHELGMTTEGLPEIHVCATDLRHCLLHLRIDLSNLIRHGRVAPYCAQPDDLRLRKLRVQRGYCPHGRFE